VEVRKWKDTQSITLQTPSKSRKNYFLRGYGDPVVVASSRITREKGDPRLLGSNQNMSKMIKAVIPRNPIKKAKKFVVAL
jgi:hypothetical protein